MPVSPQYGRIIKFDEAVSHLKQKIQIPTESYKDLLGHIHARAFTVAGATKTQLLDDLYKSVVASIEQGETITSFRKRFDEVVAKHGWSYNGKRGWRTQVIYQNNKNTARAAGRWQQQERIKHRRPYLLYLTAGDQRVRKEHQKWHYILLPLDHKFWDSHYPPNGWMCRCKVVSLSDADIERMGITVTPDHVVEPLLKPFKVADPETGEELEKLPGIDLGWNYNPGKAWLGADKSTGEMLGRLDKNLREVATPIFNEIINQGESYFKKQLATAAAKQALSKIDSGTVFVLGHMQSDVFEKVIAKSPKTKSTLIVIEHHAMMSAINVLGYEKATELINIVQAGTYVSFNTSVVKLELNGVIITVQIDGDFNRVVAIQKI
ncbi:MULTISPECIES: phage minor head protein [Pseudoalteromonas]|uniref:Phage head morphogenesis protein n=1 Tax=Pseudoalteromonas amylolytica TaxID=1859457 RepID=A0A1S1MWX0_9GAMM|nr:MULTISPECIES: phage minor head protein [Pseudoalteromonas]OHU85489.1 phage head morphogenesis protein [Pseudoalteromonas sp. JW3]OHU91723.1 phage head morphogenesis protein [Pseudoalteromonas amylolytica]